MARPRALVLVLEDEALARNYLVRLLEATQLVEVVGAIATVGEARQVLAASPVDVVFVDVQLPGGVTGLELIQSYRAGPDGPGAAQRPLFVLATAFEHHAMQAFELGVVDYLVKPFNAERVEQCVRRLVELLANAHRP